VVILEAVVAVEVFEVEAATEVDEVAVGDSIENLKVHLNVSLVSVRPFLYNLKFRFYK
jgi:hypothetical protein